MSPKRMKKGRITMKKKPGKQIVPRRFKTCFPSHVWPTFCPVCDAGIANLVELREIPATLGISDKTIGEMIDLHKVEVGFKRKGRVFECLVDLRSLKRIPARVHKTMTHIM